MKIIKLLFLSILIFSSTLYGDGDEKKKDILSEEERLEKIELYKEEIRDINEELKKNIWTTRYGSYLTYRRIEKELSQIKKEAKKYSHWQGEKYKELSYQLVNKIKIKENELELISEYKDSPIGKRITPATIEKAPEITNPFIIIESLSYIQLLKQNAKDYNSVNLELAYILERLETKTNILKKLNLLDKSKKKQIEDELAKLKLETENFLMVVNIVSATYDVYERKIAQIIQEVNNSIYDEVIRTIKLMFFILILILVAFGLKFGLQKYIHDDDRHYSSNKLINFISIVVIIFVLLFYYIDNVSYLVTILGFASAGIAIALKDWFMSIFGWMAIMTSGAITVGDRIKVMKGGIEVVGDVLDISLFKISIREDITLTSYNKNRRTGRVFFIPNNYIFTDVIANYTFNELRTVWDGIDLYITFDSNHKKAVEIAKQIVVKHAKGYTELTKKRLQKMRRKYVLRSANPEPRIFSFIEPYGIVISSWYYTNSHATLALRSTISMEILDAFLKADDIKIAYPTQTLRVTNSSNQQQAESMLPGGSANGLFDPPQTS